MLIYFDGAEIKDTTTTTTCPFSTPLVSFPIMFPSSKPHTSAYDHRKPTERSLYFRFVANEVFVVLGVFQLRACA